VNLNKIVWVWEVLDSFQVARRTYEHVLSHTTTHEEVAKNVICVLIWLETILGVKVLQEVLTMKSDSRILSQSSSRQMLSIATLSVEATCCRELLENIPTIVGLCGRRMVDFRFFKFHRALVARGIDMIRNTIALHVVNDHLYTMLRQYENEDSMVNPRPAPRVVGAVCCP
jgi:hypothetical protein